MALNAVSSTYYEYRKIKYLHCTLCFGRKVNVPGRIKKRYMSIFNSELSLMRKNSYPSFTFDSISIE
mgnify:CR=1 FL=1